MDQEGEIQSTVLSEQFPEVKCFLQHYTYYRSLRDAPYPINESDFWDEVSGAFLGSATLAWYNVFADCKSGVHWSKLISNMPKEVEEDFRDRIYKSTGLNEKSYKKVRDDIKTLRDKYVAHRDLNWQKDIWNSPNFENALKIAKVYECWVNDLLQREGSPPLPSLAGIIEEAQHEVKDVIALLSSQKS